MLFSASPACFEHLPCCFLCRWVHSKGKNSNASDEGMCPEQGRSPLVCPDPFPNTSWERGPAAPLTWSSSPHPFGWAGFVPFCDEGNARLIPEPLPHACSCSPEHAPAINYCPIILKRGRLLESPVNQAWNYHCGLSVSLSPPEQLTWFLVEIPSLKPLECLPPESSSVRSCAPRRSVARQAGRGASPLMTAICKFL